MIEAAGRVVERADAVVVGGGVVGCAVLLELARRGIEAVLLEAEPDVGEGASKANSAIIHTGFDAKPGTIEARLLRRSAERWPAILDDLGVPWLACGALMLARSEEEATRLEDVATLARAHGVSVELVDRAWLTAEAPYVTDAAVRGLLVPDEAIVDPFWLTRGYAEAAIGLGARVLTRARVVSLAVTERAVEAVTDGGVVIRAVQAFDCAGIRADEVAALAGDASFAITPRKGEFLVSERTAGVERIVLPIPGPLGKGMLVTPIVFGGVLLGPTADDGTDKADRATTTDGRRRILESCRSLVPAVDEMAPIRAFAGVRPVSSTGDYIIRPSIAGDRLTIVAGIRSTGVSASPGIAEAAVDVAAGPRGWSGVARRRATARPPELATETGAIVCVCRSIGQAEVASALAGETVVTTTDSLKRRCGVGFGDCQGNQCAVEAVARIAAARGVAPTEVEKGSAGSWILASGSTPHTGPDDADPSRRPLVSGTDGADVVVVGGGLAGVGAALRLAGAGLRVTVVERRARPGGALAAIDPGSWTDAERTALERIGRLRASDAVGWLGEATVVALDHDGRTWRVDVATATGSRTLSAERVVLATGGYVTPREHGSLDGPRPSGVMTADLVGDALDRGWLPARRAVVVGHGRLARGIAMRLGAAGVTVHLLAGPAGAAGVPGTEADPGVAGTAATEDVGHAAGPQRPAGPAVPAPGILAIRGEPRLEAVRLEDGWVAADGLVLAAGLSPATFLLRGLGIGDERPGVPAPVAADGSLPMPGLWAAGTCVVPDVDHGASLAAGEAVAHAILATPAAFPVGA